MRRWLGDGQKEILNESWEVQLKKFNRWEFVNLKPLLGKSIQLKYLNYCEKSLLFHIIGA